MRLAERLIASVSKSYAIDGNEIEIGASIGISLAPDDSLDCDELIRTPTWLSTTPRRIAAASASSSRRWTNRFALAEDGNDLRIALAEQQFEVHFQPVVSVATGR